MELATREQREDLRYEATGIVDFSMLNILLQFILGVDYWY
jgi:hypothetical protein